MKKYVALFVTVLFLASTCSSMALAAAKAASARSGLVGKYGFGCQGLAITSNAGTLPTVQYYLSNNMAVEGGFGLSSAAGATTIVAMAAVKNRFLAPLGNIYPQWGGGISLISAAGTTTIILAANVGAEYFVTPDFSIEGNISPIAISMASGTTSFNLMGPVALPSVVVGAHLYI